MTTLDILASIESLAPDALEGWTELIADLRSWGVNERTRRFNRDAEACWAKQLIEGYLAAVKTGA